MTDEKIERTARAICRELGVDPDESVGHGYGDDRTPAERAADKSGFIPMIMLYSPRWRLYRGQAAMAMATAAAIRE